MGFNRYRPYVKRVGEFLKTSPSRVGEIAKYTASKVSSISDAIDNNMNSPLGILMRDQLSRGLKTDLDQFMGINKLVGDVSKAGNMVMEGDILGGFNKGIGGYKTFEKKYKDIEKQHKDTIRIEDEQATKQTNALKNKLKNVK